MMDEIITKMFTKLFLNTPQAFLFYERQVKHIPKKQNKKIQLWGFDRAFIQSFW
jgi:hypothetical protein